MALEDGAALGLVLSKLTNKSREQKLFALKVYEECRKERTEMVVERGNFQQYMYHIHDGKEQEERDRRLQMFGEIDKDLFKTPEALTKPRMGSGDDPLPWRYHGVGGWLLTYDLEKDVEYRWGQAQGGTQARPLL